MLILILSVKQDKIPGFYTDNLVLCEEKVRAAPTSSGV